MAHIAHTPQSETPRGYPRDRSGGTSLDLGTKLITIGGHEFHEFHELRAT